jgi:hypothetical protein
MALLKTFAAQLGDYEFSCQRQVDGTCIWRKKLLNTSGAEPEEVSLDDVPVPVLRAFSQAQVRKQVSQPA